MSGNKQANEMCETIADIVAALRKCGDEWVGDMSMVYMEGAGRFALYLADCLEAAWKRETSQSWHHREMEELILRHEKEVAELRRERDAAEDRGCHNALDLIEKIDAQYGIDNKIVGNAAAMRDACAKMRQLLMLRGDGKAYCILSWDEFNDSQKMLRAALSAPPRNCDRYKDAPSAYADFIVPWKLEGRLDDVPTLQDFANWLFAPAEEGESDGSK